MEVKLTEIERLCSQAQGSQPSTNVSSDEAVAAAKAAETCARVSAKALEVAHLQAMLAQVNQRLRMLCWFCEGTAGDDVHHSSHFPSVPHVPALLAR